MVLPDWLEFCGGGTPGPPQRSSACLRSAWMRTFSPGTFFKASFHFLIFSSLCFRPAPLTFRNVVRRRRQRVAEKEQEASLVPSPPEI